MSIHRCPKCSIPLLDVEIEQDVCPGCNAPLGPPSGPPRPDVPAPPIPLAPSRAAPFLLGLIVGCLVGLATLWTALRLGTPLPGGGTEPTAEVQAVRPQKTEADNQARVSEAG